MRACLRCGQCCRVSIIDEIYKLDLIREPRLREHVEPIRPIVGLDEDLEQRYLLMTPCPFLVGDLCSIYPTRPDICIAHEPGDKPFCAARVYEEAKEKTQTDPAQ